MLLQELYVQALESGSALNGRYHTVESPAGNHAAQGTVSFHRYCSRFDARRNFFARTRCHTKIWGRKQSAQWCHQRDSGDQSRGTSCPRYPVACMSHRDTKCSLQRQ